MIKVEIRQSAFEEFVDAKARDEYILAQLIAAGIPLESELPLRFTRVGQLAGDTVPECGRYNWYWFEAGEVALIAEAYLSPVCQ